MAVVSYGRRGGPGGRGLCSGTERRLPRLLGCGEQPAAHCPAHRQSSDSGDHPGREDALPRDARSSGARLAPCRRARDDAYARLHPLVEATSCAGVAARRSSSCCSSSRLCCTCGRVRGAESGSARSRVVNHSSSARCHSRVTLGVIMKPHEASAMSWTRVIVLVTLLGACAGEPTRAPQEVRAQVERTMGAFASMDLQGFKAGLAEDVVAFEMDLEGKPVRLGSRDEAVRFAEEMFAQVKKMGASLKLDIHSTDCRATSSLA